MLGVGFVLAIVAGLGLAAYPFFRRASRRRTQARLTFLTTRLRGQAEQLSHTTSSKFPTDYQRLQQQVAADLAELSQLLRTKSRLLPAEVSQPAWDLAEEAARLLPDSPLIQRPIEQEAELSHPAVSRSRLRQLAPELLPSIASIEADDQAIRRKVEEKSLANKEEILTLHEAGMARYQDILEGYLKIKENPKEYYQAEERLAKSRQALEKFDADLDETLRQINEGDMMTFEVSLRMMAKDAD